MSLSKPSLLTQICPKQKTRDERQTDSASRPIPALGKPTQESADPNQIPCGVRFLDFESGPITDVWLHIGMNFLIPRAKRRLGGQLGLLLAGVTVGCGPAAKVPPPSTNAAPSTVLATPSASRAPVASLVPGPAGTSPLPQLADRGDATDQLQAAESLVTRGKTNEAVELYSKIALENPDYEEAHFARGFFLARLGRNLEAIACYEAALRLVPDYAEVHNNLGNLLVQEQRYDEAVPHFEAAIAKLPDNAKYYNNLGTAYARLSRIPEALPQFNRAVQLNAEYPEAWFNLGRSFAQTGQFEEALRPVQTALRLRPDLAPARKLLEEIQRKLSDRKP